MLQPVPEEEIVLKSGVDLRFSTGAHLYRTTTLFLEKMCLDSVEELPPLAPFLPDNLEELAANE